MKIERIKVGKSVEGLGQWNRLDLDVLVDEGENPETIYVEAKKLLDKLLIGENMQPSREIPIQQSEPMDSKETATQRILKQINESSDMVILESFKLLVKNNPELQEAYDNKLQSFQK